MKRILTVLFVAVLAAGVIFAGDLKATGSATLSFGYNLDTKAWGFANANAISVKGTITLETDKPGSKGEGDLWGEITATYALKINVTNATTAAFNMSGSITAANIHVGEKLVIGILNAGGGYNFATSYYKVGNAVLNKVAAPSNGAPGFNVNYDGWKGGFGANGVLKTDTTGASYTIFAHFAAKTIKLAEDALSIDAAVTAKAAKAAADEKANKDAWLNAKAAYKKDKLSGSLAADIALLAKDDIRAEVAAKAGYDKYTLDVYYYYQKDDSNLLSAKLAAKINDNITSVWVDGRNLLKDDRELGVGVDAAFDAVECGLEAWYAFADKAVELGAYVIYGAEKFDVELDLAAGLDLDPNAAKVLTALQPTLTISSKAIIDNATLALVWDGADFAAEDTLGAVTASVKIAF